MSNVKAAPVPHSGWELRYQEATNLWVGTRRQELNEARENFEAKTGKECSGSTFLRKLFALCNKEEQSGRRTFVDAEGLIVEYTLETLTGNGPLRIWRLINDHGLIDLRLAPDAARRQAQMLDMVSLSKTRSLRRERKKNPVDEEAANAPMLNENHTAITAI